MRVTILQIHKRSSHEFKYIQDKFSISKNNTVIALADGTTQSFRSEIWAEMLVDEFTNHPTSKPTQLIKQFRNCATRFKKITFEYSKTPATALLEKTKQRKGATASFLGIQLKSNNTLELISVGDVNVILIRTNKKIEFFPFSDLNKLDAESNFINSEELVKNNFKTSSIRLNKIQLMNGDKVIATTDALARLLLQKPDKINDLVTLNNFSNLLFFCNKHWNNHDLQEDDISAIILDPKEKNELVLFKPPENFKFQKKAEIEFKPTAEIQYKVPKNTERTEKNLIQKTIALILKINGYLKNRIQKK